MHLTVSEGARLAGLLLPEAKGYVVELEELLEGAPDPPVRIKSLNANVSARGREPASAL